MLDDAVAVGGVGKLQTKDLCVLHRLAETIGGFLVVGLGFNDGDCKVRAVAEEIVGALLFAADRAVASDDDPAIGESPLLVDVVVRPSLHA